MSDELELEELDQELELEELEELELELERGGVFW